MSATVILAIVAAVFALRTLIDIHLILHREHGSFPIWSLLVSLWLTLALAIAVIV